MPRSTRKDATKLAVATALKSALQLLTPLVLVRLLNQSEFGEYRLFWLLANTATLLLPMGMERSLLYFLPKSNDADRATYVTQTILYFAGVAALALATVLGVVYLLPGSLVASIGPTWAVAGFLFLWIFSTPIRYLPNADQNNNWQAGSIVVLAVFRAATVVGTAWYFRSIESIFIALLLWSLFQTLLLLYYFGSRYGIRQPIPTAHGFSSQLAFAVPFGISQMLSGARRQVEQWIVAFMFLPAQLAVFSIGISFNILLNLVRSSLSNVVMPRMSKSYSSGDISRAIELNNRSNTVVFFIVSPLIFWLSIFAEPVISLLYTDEYLEAVPVLRIYLVTLLVMSIELSSVLMLLEQGRWLAKVSAAVLVGSSLVSLAGGILFGLTGVALGSLVGEVVGRTVNFTRTSRLLGYELGEIQDWHSLAKILLACLVASLAGWSFVSPVDPVQNLVGTAAFAAVFMLVAWLAGLNWLFQSVFGSRRWGQNDSS